MVAGLPIQIVWFELDITGKKWLWIALIPPTHHQIWQVPNDKDDLNLSPREQSFRYIHWLICDHQPPQNSSDHCI